MTKGYVHTKGVCFGFHIPKLILFDFLIYVPLGEYHSYNINNITLKILRNMINRRVRLSPFKTIVMLCWLYVCV